MTARRRRAVTTVAVLLAAALAGCGIPVDRAPQDVADDEVLTAPGAAASDSPASGNGQRVYFLAPDAQDGVRLQQVRRDVSPTASGVLAALFEGLTDTERSSRRLTTQIPVGTRLKSVQALSDGTVVIDVDSAIFEAKGANLATAVAQIVYTATSLTGIERVRLLVDGQPQNWVAGDGRERSGDLTPLAYAALYPSNEPDLPPVPSPPGPTTVPPTTLAPAVPPPATTPPASVLAATTSAAPTTTTSPPEPEP